MKTNTRQRGKTDQPRPAEKSVGQLIVDGLQEFADSLQCGSASIPQKFNCHRVRLALVPTRYDAELVRRTREVLSASQTVFAQFLGVSVSAVRAWEQGVNLPQDAACRLMDEIRHDPEYWRKRMRSLAVEKSPNRSAARVAP